MRRLAKLSLLGIAGLVFFVVIAFTVFTLVIVPSLESYRPYLASYLSQKMSRPVNIGALSAHWDGVSPRFVLKDITIQSVGSAQHLGLHKVDVKLSWFSFFALEPRLSLIQIDGPTIDLRRLTDKKLALNGFVLNTSSSDRSLVNWLLRQPRILINDAHFRWQDDYLGLPAFTVNRGKIELKQSLLGHKLNIVGQSNFGPKTAISLNAFWQGDRIQEWQKWQGHVELVLTNAQVNRWAQYLNQFGLVRTGEGNGSIRVAFSHARIDSLEAKVSLRNLSWQGDTAQEIKIPVVAGQLMLTRKGSSYRLYANDLSLASHTGLAFNHSRIEGNWSEDSSGKGQLVLDNADLFHLAPFMRAFGLDRNPVFSRFSPSGKLQNLTVTWQGRTDAPRRYRLSSHFSKLAWQAFGNVPGVSGVSGKITFDEQGGELILANNTKAEIRMPQVFPHPLAFHAIDAVIQWSRGTLGEGSLTIQKLRFANQDLAGWLTGRYDKQAQGPGIIDIQSGLQAVQAKRVVHYLPYQVGQTTKMWLAKALQGGLAKDVRMHIKGDLAHFPFNGGKHGDFLVEAKVTQGKLFYHKDWPAITDIDASIMFHNERMEIASRTAKTLGVPLQEVKVSIVDLTKRGAKLAIQGVAIGKLSDMLKFTVQSPVDRWLVGFLGQVQATGQAALDLDMHIPITKEAEQPRIKGSVRFSDNKLWFKRSPIPELSEVQGKLDFTERAIHIPKLILSTLGGKFMLNAHTDSTGSMNFSLEGEADSAKVASFYAPALTPYVHGRSRYRAEFFVRDQLTYLSLSSSLIGTSILFAPPLGKTKQESMDLSLTVHPTHKKLINEWNILLGTMNRARLRTNETGQLLQGRIAIGRPSVSSALLSDGLYIDAYANQINVEDYLHFLGPSSISTAVDFPLTLNIASPSVTWLGSRLDEVNTVIKYVPMDRVWHVKLNSRQITGSADYFSQGRGRLLAHLERLVFNPSWLESASDKENEGKISPYHWPAIAVQIENLFFGNKMLGAFALKAQRQPNRWLVDSLSLIMPEGKLTGKLIVDHVEQDPALRRVTLDSTVDSQDIGKLLERFDITNTFYQGKGQILAHLSWPGSLVDFAIQRLTGKINLDLKDGRFAKMNPGVARLLGIISLQSLARRIRLDFTDVFSEGFSFDTLYGSTAITTGGLFKSTGFHIKGPGADVTIQGQVDLSKDQQLLNVHVEPHLSEGVALATGAALINPIAGVAAFAAQKIFKDPVSKIFSVNYRVTGSLQEPTIQKLPNNPGYGKHTNELNNDAIPTQ